MSTTEHDQKTNRCRRLGHPVTFGYCRCERGENKPCPLILNCWWEHFDVRRFIEENYSPEVIAELERAASGPPPSKVVSLVEMVRQARERLAQKDDEQP